MSSVATPSIRYEVLGTLIAGIGLDQAMTIVEQWVASGQPGYLCHANVHGVMEARRDRGLRQAYAAAGLVVADGVPLVWVGRLLGQRAVRRVYGPDFMLLLAERAAARGYRVFFYGGASGVAADLAARFSRRFPGLRVVGAQSPPFRPLTAEEDAATVARINASGADIVWVGLGCPKQERWMAEHRAALTAPVLIGVGAAFDFHAGRVPQAPRWLMPLGLEWLYRLIQEPRRLWRRYLLYNPLFVLLVAGQLLRGARRRVSGSP